MKSKFFKRLKSNKGFSLVELMVVVAIIGILATLAIPKYATFQAKARQSEAKVNLDAIFSLESIYFSENSKYFEITSAIGRTGPSPTACNTPKNDLGFTPLGECKNIRYQYTVALAAASSVGFTGTAKSLGTWGLIVPGCTSADDQWQTNEKNELKFAQLVAGTDQDAVKLCP